MNCGICQKPVIEALYNQKYCSLRCKRSAKNAKRRKPGGYVRRIVNRSEAWWKSQRARLVKARAAPRTVTEKMREAARRISVEFKDQRLETRSHHPRMQPDENHCSAQRYQLRAPNGVIFVFKNANHFVREHPDLFEPKDIIWRTRKTYKGNATTCNAASCLRSLRPSDTRKRQDVTWKGWTWVSVLDKRFNDAADYLDRSDAAGRSVAV